MGFGQYSDNTYGNSLARTPSEYTKQRKTVFGTHAQTCHVWAQQNPETYYGRSSDGRIFFEGPSIFSYRSSWTIARFVTNKRGERAVLFNIDSYSISTTQHSGHALSAVSGVPIFEVPNPERDPDKDAMRAYFAGELEEAIRQAARARTNTHWHIHRAERLVGRANNLARFMGWRWRLKTPDWSDDYFAAAKARAAKEAAKRAAETKRLQAERKAQLAKDIIAWRAGEHVGLYAYHVGLYAYQGPVMLRLVGEEIQTSKGARVPVDHAKRLWPHIKRCHDTATSWQSNGHKLTVGHFRVDCIDADGTLRAGCHVIPFAELAAMATNLGLLEK